MRLLTFTAGYPPYMAGGPAVHTKELNQALARAGHQPWVVTFHPPDGPGNTSLVMEDGVGVCRVQNYPFSPADYTARYHQQNIRALEGALRILQSGAGPFEAIVLQGYFLGPAAMTVRAATGAPVIFHVHNMYSAPTEYHQEDEQRYFETLESWLIRESAAIIPVSDYIAQMCLRLGADAERMTVIPKALHLEEFAGDWQPHDRQTVLFVGRLAPEKGLDTLVAAIALMRDAGTPVRLLVAGTGEEDYVDRLFRRVDELDLRRHVAFLGFVGGRDLVRLYQTSSVTVVPSHMEAFGRVAIEAMAAGAPVVVSDVGGLGPLVRPSETGWRVPAGNPEALAGALTEALVDHEKASRLAAQGRAEVRSLYSWERVLDATIDVYLRVTGGR